MSETRSERPQGWTVFLIVSGYLIVMFVWRFFVAAHEYPMRGAQLLDIGLDGLLVVSLIGLRVRLFAAFSEHDSRRTIGGVLFWFALAAGIGLFAIRFSSDAAWWTGHRMYYLLPR